jgi:MGT family glycosyltransferase
VAAGAGHLDGPRIIVRQVEEMHRSRPTFSQTPTPNCTSIDIVETSLYMQKIAYVGLPAHGHTNPTLAVMKALVARGHHILYYNAESFRDKLAHTGVDFRAFPEPMPSEKEMSAALHSLINASLLLSTLSRPLTHHLLQEFEQEKPEVVIYDSAAMWGYIAARCQEIPQICFVTTFVLDGLMHMLGARNLALFIWKSLPHAPRLLRWKRSMANEFGRENSGGITEYADLNIVFSSKAFHPENNSIDERFRFVGPSIDTTGRPADFPFDKLPEEKPCVYISLGTITNQNIDFYNTAFVAFAEYRAQFILSAGALTDLTQLSNVPDNFIVRNHVPQLQVLRRADVFVTHGGMNSVHEGLYFGVPQIVIPQQLEQYINGKRVVDAEAGLIPKGYRVSRQVSVEALRLALDQILSDPSYKTNAARLGETLRAAGGYEQAANDIEHFIQAGIT